MLNFDKKSSQNQLNKVLIEENLIKQNGEVFPVSLTPYLINLETYQRIAYHCENIMSAIQKLLQFYLKSKSFQAYYSEFERYRYITLTQPLYKPQVQLARFDLAIDKKHGSFHLMETNTACPGGAVIVPKIKKIYENLNCTKDFLKDFNIHPQQMDDETYFIKEIIDTYKSIRGTNPRHIGFGYNEFRPIKSDLTQLLKITESLGYSAEIFNIKDVKIKNNKAYATSKSFDLVHHKFDILTEEDGQQRPCLFENNSKETENYFQALKDNLFISVNSLPSMTVSESKKIIPALLNKTYHFLFSKQEISSIESLCILTYPLKSGENNINEVYERVLNNKNKYVVKYAYDTRSRGVFIGTEASQSEWKDILKTTKSIPSVAQKYIDHVVENIVSPKTLELISCRTNIAIYLMRGKASGILCRSSQGYKSNFYADGIYRSAYIFK